jgi:thioredoxin-related protein
MKIASLRPFACLFALLLCGFSASASDAKWFTDYDKAVETAKAEHRNILMNFTGSDWCPYCIQMDKEVLNTQQFEDYAGKNLVLMTVDFPQTKQLPQKVQDQNNDLQQRYAVEGMPTFLLIDPTGKVLQQYTGYLPGGPAAFIAMLQGKKS